MKQNPLFAFVSSPLGMVAVALLIIFVFFKGTWGKIVAIFKGETQTAKESFKANGIAESALSYPPAFYQREADALKSYYDGANPPFLYSHDTDVLALFKKLEKPEDVQALNAAFGIMTDGSSFFSFNYWFGVSRSLVNTLQSHTSTATFEAIKPQLEAAKLL